MSLIKSYFIFNYSDKFIAFIFMISLIVTTQKFLSSNKTVALYVMMCDTKWKIFKIWCIDNEITNNLLKIISVNVSNNT